MSDTQASLTITAREIQHALITPWINSTPLHTFDVLGNMWDRMKAGFLLFHVCKNDKFVQTGDRLMFRKLDDYGDLASPPHSAHLPVTCNLDFTAGWIQPGGTNGIEVGWAVIQLVPIIS